MKLYVPIFANGIRGPAFEKKTSAEAFVPISYTYHSTIPKPKIHCFLGRCVEEVNGYCYKDQAHMLYLLALPENKIKVIPPLVDIRSTSKNYPSDKRIAYCALKGISPYYRPSFKNAESSEDDVEEEY